MELNLKAENTQEKRIKAYLEENASAVLADKINNGVFIEKDGQRLLNRKTLQGCLENIRTKAQKQAVKGCAMIDDEVVFGWAVHYFEEDSIEEKLFKEDGTEFKAKTSPKKPSKTDEEDNGEDFNDKQQKRPEKNKDEAKKDSNAQLNLFDMLG